MKGNPLRYVYARPENTNALTSFENNAATSDRKSVASAWPNREMMKWGRKQNNEVCEWSENDTKPEES